MTGLGRIELVVFGGCSMQHGATRHRELREMSRPHPVTSNGHRITGAFAKWRSEASAK
ncbi:hypothetical protein SAMN05443245_7592 [Paraburkholderia fungorum]|uniref:Uncharacterized protein n=1 Tax=Paraburkholderia fungorum TaxID=134537 RepID=A0A1H1JZL4_9BURK|nr:hypothetical protein SAMN05443245_7592 [Paraburkholderia fungorum]